MSDLTAQNIRHYRKKKGITQAELAAKVGVSEMSIRRYETTGKANREPSANLFDKIAKKLDTTSDILRGKVSNHEIPEIAITPPTQAELDMMYKEAVASLMDDMKPSGEAEVLKYAKYIHSQPEYRKNSE